MAQLTETQLAAELAGTRHNMEELRVVRERLEAELTALKAQLAALRQKTPSVRLVGQVSVRVNNPRTTYEFDPAIPGDFKRASELARLNHGVVRRIA